MKGPHERLLVGQGTPSTTIDHIKEKRRDQPEAQFATLESKAGLMFGSVSSQREFLMSHDASCLTTSAGSGQHNVTVLVSRISTEFLPGVLSLFPWDVAGFDDDDNWCLGPALLFMYS